MLRPVVRIISLALLLVSAVEAQSARAQCPGTPICPPDDAPCEIPEGTLCAVPAGVYDLGARALTVLGELRFEGGDRTDLAVGDLRVGPRGVLRAVPAPGNAFGAIVNIVSSGAVEVQADRNARGLIDVSAAGEGGVLGIAAQRDVTLRGQIRANGQGSSASGGQVSIAALGGDVAIGGLGIEARAADSEGIGGLVDLLAEMGSVAIEAPVIVGRGDCSSCEVFVEAAGDIRVAGRTAEIDAKSTLVSRGLYGDGADGGLVTLSAGARIEVAAPITANGSGEIGSGGEVLLVSNGEGEVAITDEISLNGSNGGDGGSFIVSTSGAISIAGVVSLQGDGPDSGGGDASIGDFALGLPSTIRLSGTVDASGAVVGGEIDVIGEDSLEVTGSLRANSGSEGGGGFVTLAGCAVSLSATGRIEARGGGSTLLQAGEGMEIQGQIRSPRAGANVLQTRAVSPRIGTSAVIEPAPTVQLDPTLPCCGAGCAPPTTTTTVPETTTTTTSTTVAETTSTLAPTSTSTTTLLSTTTTSSTAAPTTTTTTLLVATTTAPPATTTSSTAAPTTTTTVTLPLAPTTTTLPPAEPCEDLTSVGYEAVECRVQLLQGIVTQQPVAALGGARFATRFRGQLARTQRAVAKAKSGKQTAAALRLARKQLRAFERGIDVATRRRGMQADLAEALRTAVQRVANDLALLARSR